MGEQEGRWEGEGACLSPVEIFSGLETKLGDFWNASRAWALPPPLMPKKVENDKRGSIGRRIAHPPAEPAQC